MNDEYEGWMMNMKDKWWIWRMNDEYEGWMMNIKDEW